MSCCLISCENGSTNIYFFNHSNWSNSEPFANRLPDKNDIFEHLPVRREGAAYDRYKRLIAICYSGTVNLNAKMMRQGWALEYRRYSMDYVNAESASKDVGVGMWRGEFVPPWEWRKSRR